jgi:hypothetical protein
MKMANELAWHAGETVLLRAEIVGLGSEGPYVRVDTSQGGATCFWAPTAAVARIESGDEAADERTAAIRSSTPVAELVKSIAEGS